MLSEKANAIMRKYLQGDTRDDAVCEIMRVLASRTPSVEKAAEAAFRVQDTFLAWSDVNERDKAVWRSIVTAAAPFLQGGSGQGDAQGMEITLEQARAIRHEYHTLIQGTKGTGSENMRDAINKVLAAHPAPVRVAGDDLCKQGLHYRVDGVCTACGDTQPAAPVSGEASVAEAMCAAYCSEPHCLSWDELGSEAKRVCREMMTAAYHECRRAVMAERDAELSTLRETVKRLSAPINNKELNSSWRESGSRVDHVSWFKKIIADRVNAPQPKGAADGKPE